VKLETRIKVLLVETAGDTEAALDLACKTLARLMPATSMGMLRCGKKARDIDSEYGGK
jgi:hypothetical protein